MNIMLDEKQQERDSCQAEQDASMLRLECSLKEGDEREKALISDTCSIEASYENQIQTLNEKMTHISNEKETFSTIVEEIQQELESCQTKQKASELELESFKKEHDMMLLSLTEKEKASISDAQAVEENYKSEIQSLIEKIDCISNEKKSFSDKLDEVQQALKSSISEQKALQLDLVSLKSEHGKLQEETGERIRLEQVENDTQEKKTTALATQNEELKTSVISLQGDLEEQQNLCALEKQKVVDAFKEAEVTLQTTLCNKASHDTELQVFNVEVARLSTEKEGLSTSLSEVKQELESYQAEKNKLLLELETVQKDSEENALHLSADLESKHNIAVQELNADIEDLLNEQDKMNIMLDEKQQELESCQAEQDASMLRLECSLKECDEREKALIPDTCSIEASYENQIQTLNEKMTHISNEKETFSTIVEGIQQELESCQAKQKASELELESFKKEHDMMLLSLTEKEKASISDAQAVEENYKSEIQSLIEKN